MLLKEQHLTLTIGQALPFFLEWVKQEVKSDTQQIYRYAIRGLGVFTRNKNIEQITSQDISDYFTLMRLFEWQQNSFVMKVNAFRQFFNYFRLEGFNCIHPDLVPSVQREYKIPRIADDGDYEKLTSFIKTYDKANDYTRTRDLALLGLLHDSMARIGEIRELNIDDIDLEKSQTIIQTEKGKRIRPHRQIFWSDETHQHLTRWVEYRKSLQTQIIGCDPEALFIGVGNQHKGKRFTKQSMGAQLKKFAKLAGVPHWNPHSYRHAGARRMVKNHAGASEIMSVLGHASIQSSEPYTRLFGKDTKQAWELSMSDKLEN